MTFQSICSAAVILCTAMWFDVHSRADTQKPLVCKWTAKPPKSMESVMEGLWNQAVAITNFRLPATGSKTTELYRCEAPLGRTVSI